MSKRNNRKIWKAVLCIVFSTSLAFVLSNTVVYYFTSMLAFKSSIEENDYQIIDLYSVVLDENSSPMVSDNIVLVTVDGLPREDIASVVEIIKKADSKVIGIDIIFEYKCGIDSALLEATNASNIVLAATVDGDFKLHKSYFCDSLHKAYSGVALLEQPSPISMVRQYRTKYFIGDSLYNTFATEIIRRSGEKVKHYDDDNQYIFYPAIDFMTIESDILVQNPEKCKEFFKDKIVLVGDDKNMQDVHPTAFGAMSGLRIQASIIETILGDHRITTWPKWVEWMMAIISCILLIIVNMILANKMPTIGKLLFRFFQLIILYGCFTLGCSIFKNHYLYVDITPTLSMIAVGLLAYDFWNGISLLIDKYILKNNKT